MAAGPLQAAAGIKGGAEAAIHAMKDIFEEDNTEAVILVDASNAFNSLNRKTALHNMQIICPDFATILINTYRESTRMLMQGGHELLSQEGTTQGDNLAMSFYALATSSLQETLKISAPEVKQVWLADDATAAGSLANLRTWWGTIIEQGKSNYEYRAWHIHSIDSFCNWRCWSRMATLSPSNKYVLNKYVQKCKQNLSSTISWIRCKISFIVAT